MKKTQTMAFANLISSILLIILGIWAWIQTGHFEEVKNSYVQAATFPRVMIAGMLIFSVILLIQSILRLMTLKDGDTDYLASKAASINFVKDRPVLAAVAVIILGVGFVALFKILGYVICSMIISLIIMYMIGKRNWLQMVLVSILVPLGMWLIFYKVLTVNIPMGPLSFLSDLVGKL